MFYIDFLGDLWYYIGVKGRDPKTGRIKKSLGSRA
nr:MAG TPA: hypothetical protein [Caudoviricetes sp.]